jgi:putative ABC transport system permease protein
MSRSIAATWTAGSYFESLGIPLKRGRLFTDADGRANSRVVIISEMLAHRLWPDQDPIGHQIKWGIEQSTAPWMTIVGVVGDVNQSALGTEPIAQTYEPIFQQPDAARATNFYRTVNVVARSTTDPHALLAVLRAVVKRIDPELPLSDAAPVVTVVADSVKPQRFSMTVVGAFAIVALALAGIGIYGVLAHAVGQQTHEIGVRVALGASRSEVLWTVLRRALTLMAIGSAIGAAGALALTRVMAGMLYEVRPTDAATFAGSGMLLALLAVLAGLVPAWRATRVDPLRALRAQ